MRKENRELIRVFDEFRKLNIAALLPDLTNGEFGILKAVSCCEKRNGCEDEIRISDIVGHLKIPAPAVSRTMRSLEEKGLVIRTVNKKDRRNVCVRLTQAGADKLDEAEQILDEFQEAVFGSMGVENMSRLIQYLQELQEVMKRELEQRKHKRQTEEKEAGS